MDFVYSADHKKRNSKTELSGGELVAPFECPARAEIIRERCLERAIGEMLAPKVYGDELLLSVHAPNYVQFMQSCWQQWQAGGYKGEALATCWPSRAMPRLIEPKEIDGKVGFYALAGETSISEGTVEAAFASATVAATAADLVQSGKESAFALCRPPGHHAATDMFGGYCFFNNAAIAAQRLLDGGAARVAVLDTDFHHGNGTQQIFYQRNDVMFLSIHGDPLDAFPYFLGHADEEGEAAGAGYTKNYPLPPNTPFNVWQAALKKALACISDYGADAIVVSLGVDTYKDDPISFFKLESNDFITYGNDIAQLGLPTVFVMEGGYAVDEIGINAVNVLEGFMG